MTKEKAPTEAKKALKEYLQDFASAAVMQEKEITYERVLKNKLFVARAVRRGVTFDLFKEICSNAPFTDQQWAEFLGINLRTLQRYKKDQKHIFNTLQSERIFELAEVVSLANTIFDTPEHFHIWLNSPSVALGGEKPIALLDSSYGKDLVMSELYSIEYGNFV